MISLLALPFSVKINIALFTLRVYNTVIILAESRAVRDGGLRFIRDRGGIFRAHVTAGESDNTGGLDF
jgi:hypothetical protein